MIRANPVWIGPFSLIWIRPGAPATREMATWKDDNGVRVTDKGWLVLGQAQKKSLPNVAVVVPAA